MTLVSGNIRRTRIFAGVPERRGIKWEWGCRRRQLVATYVATSSDSKAFLRLLSWNWSGAVKIDEFVVYPMLYLRKFRK